MSIITVIATVWLALEAAMRSSGRVQLYGSPRDEALLCLLHLGVLLWGMLLVSGVMP